MTLEQAKKMLEDAANGASIPMSKLREAIQVVANSGLKLPK